MKPFQNPNDPTGSSLTKPSLLPNSSSSSSPNPNPVIISGICFLLPSPFSNFHPGPPPRFPTHFLFFSFFFPEPQTPPTHHPRSLEECEGEEADDSAGTATDGHAVSDQPGGA
ncbi:hypothetical protein LOK49_LG04G03666 [Camellia lanceoleosa]|uniref:Uncharacterized protein n=1 Tax=Camellia lanceoleosa TaxID=1840588 RepID=A0ACC0HYQ0_9ERIC|nr:hypothetical protein LOK49_LG04G03666 [Camellia lanceoleosa]